MAVHRQRYLSESHQREWSREKAPRFSPSITLMSPARSGTFNRTFPEAICRSMMLLPTAGFRADRWNVLFVMSFSERYLMRFFGYESITHKNSWRRPRIRSP